MKPSGLPCADDANRSGKAGGDATADRYRARQHICDDQKAIERGQYVVLLGVVGEQPPWQQRFERPNDIVGDKPSSNRLLSVNKKRAGAPMERTGCKSDHTEEYEYCFPRMRIFTGDVDNFRVR